MYSFACVSDPADHHDLNPEEASLDASGDILDAFSDDELEAELTIAAANPGLSGRYDALLAERERRQERPRRRHVLP